MKLPKIEIKYKGTRRSYYIDGVKTKAKYGSGVRPKIFLPEYGVVVKFNHHSGCYPHDDAYVYNKIKPEDKKYFPKLFLQTDEYSIHELVPYKPFKSNSYEDLYRKAEHLKYKYVLEDFSYCQLGVRKDSGELVYFDYGYDPSSEMYGYNQEQY